MRWCRWGSIGVGGNLQVLVRCSSIIIKVIRALVTGTPLSRQLARSDILQVKNVLLTFFSKR